MNPNTAYHPYKKIVLISIAFVGGIVLLSLLIMLLQRIFFRKAENDQVVLNFHIIAGDRVDQKRVFDLHDHLPPLFTKCRNVLYAAKDTHKPQIANRLMRHDQLQFLRRKTEYGKA